MSHTQGRAGGGSRGKRIIDRRRDRVCQENPTFRSTGARSCGRWRNRWTKRKKEAARRRLLESHTQGREGGWLGGESPFSGRLAVLSCRAAGAFRVNGKRQGPPDRPGCGAKKESLRAVYWYYCHARNKSPGSPKSGRGSWDYEGLLFDRQVVLHHLHALDLARDLDCLRPFGARLHRAAQFHHSLLGGDVDGHDLELGLIVDRGLHAGGDPRVAQEIAASRGGAARGKKHGEQDAGSLD